MNNRPYFERWVIALTNPEEVFRMLLYGKEKLEKFEVIDECVQVSSFRWWSKCHSISFEEDACRSKNVRSKLDLWPSFQSISIPFLVKFTPPSPEMGAIVRGMSDVWCSFCLEFWWMHLDVWQESRNQMKGKEVLLREWIVRAFVDCVYVDQVRVCQWATKSLLNGPERATSWDNSIRARNRTSGSFVFASIFYKSLSIKRPTK